MDITLYHEAQSQREKNGARTSRPAVVLFHGVTGTPDEVLPLGEILHANGFDVCIPLLAGHKQDIEALRLTTAQAWYEDVQRARESVFQRDPSSLFAVGLSFGAILSLELATTSSIPLSGLVLISTPFVLRSRFRETALRLLSFFPDFFLNQLGVVQKAKRDPALFQNERKGYDAHSIGALARAKYIQRVLTPKLPDLRCPVLLLQDPNDHLVSLSSLPTLQYLLKHSDIQTEWVNGGEHELTIGPQAAKVNAKVLGFLSSLAFGGDKNAT